MNQSIPFNDQTIVRKRKVQVRKRRDRTKQRKGKTVRYFRGEGPAKGLKLSYDPNDELFPRSWVLSKDDLVLGVYRSEPTQIWESLTQEHKELCKEAFDPIPMDRQFLRQIIDTEELKRINFWENVQRNGRRKHSHPDLDVRGDKIKEAQVKGGEVILYTD